jgi:hypothetical protein
MSDAEIMDHLLLNLIDLYQQRTGSSDAPLVAIAAGLGRLLGNQSWREIYFGSVRRCVEALEAAAEPKHD